MQFPIGVVLQHSNTPSLRVAGFEDEDDDEDENEAPHEWRQKGWSYGRLWLGDHRPYRIWCPFRAHRTKTANPGLKPWAKFFRRFAASNVV